jgi:hypothetical protein
MDVLNTLWYEQILEQTPPVARQSRSLHAPKSLIKKVIAKQKLNKEQQNSWATLFLVCSFTYALGLGNAN